MINMLNILLYMMWYMKVEKMACPSF